MGQFAKQLKRFGDSSIEKSNKVLRRASLDVLRRLIVRSPVDTGRFRGNWQTGIDEAPPEMPESKDKLGSDTFSKGESNLQNAKIGNRVFIVNNLPYATRLENGWSQQAPAGMVAITIVEWTGIVQEAVEATR